MIDVQNRNTRKNWKECPREANQTRWGIIYATMSPNGYIAVSRFTHQQLGSPEAYVLLYDEDLHMVGLQPARTQTKNAYPIHPNGKYGGQRVHAFRLIHEFGLDLDETVRFPRAIIDHTGTLILDLKDTQPAVRNKKKKGYPY